MVLCYESRRLARSLGPGSSVGKRAKKGGEIGKMSASGKKKFRSPIFFSFFSQCGAYLARSPEKIRLCSLHTCRLVLK